MCVLYIHKTGTYIVCWYRAYSQKHTYSCYNTGYFSRLENQSRILKMASKVSTVMILLGLLLVLGLLIATSEGSRKKGKFTTPGGSRCRWVEKKRHNDTDVSYTLKCKCHSKGGGMMRYRCTYQTSFRGRGRNNLRFSDSFLQIIKGTNYYYSYHSNTNIIYTTLFH